MINGIMLFGVSVAGGILGGFISIAVIEAIKRYKTKHKEDIESIYVDELNIGEIKKWFSDKITSDVLKGVILYPTPENTAKWKLNIKKSEMSNMLIQAVYDEAHDNIVSYREIIFSALSPKLQELLDNNGGVFVVEA